MGENARVIGRLRAWSALVAIGIVVPLLGAASGFAPPVVVVYPITSAGAIDVSAGGNLALIIATKLTQLGGITIKPSTPGTERAKFLEAANVAGADYYITGFLTPIGADTSFITQVVSTHSGSVVFSTTGVVRTYADALAQVDVLHDAILRHAGRGLAALDAPPPAPSSSPPPAANDGSLNIGRALHKRRRPAPTPSPLASSVARAAGALPSPLPVASPSGSSARTAVGAAVVSSPAPAPTATSVSAGTTALLFAVDGALEPVVATQATKAIADGFSRLNRPTAVLGVPLGANLGRAAAICSANPGARELDAATMVVGRSETGAARVQLDLAAYDCAGTLLRSKRATATATRRGGLRDAIAKAAADATSALSVR